MRFLLIINIIGYTSASYPSWICDVNNHITMKLFTSRITQKLVDFNQLWAEGEDITCPVHCEYKRSWHYNPMKGIEIDDIDKFFQN